MNKTSVSHNDATYDLNTGGWLKHLHSSLSEALLEIVTEDVQLPNWQTVGMYKAEKKAEYDNQPDRSYSSAKKYLNSCSQRDFGFEWDKLISELKKRINNVCVPLLMARHALSKAEHYEIISAASTGHVGAMYWLGTGFRDVKDDNCLRWLSMAHNGGHVGACYEMAIHLESKGNHIEALRCLIVSADGGCDHAFMSIFDLDVLIKNMFNTKQVDLLENMLDELASTHSSSARYFKGILMIFQGKNAEGIAVLNTFLKSPKKQPPKNNIDMVYENQINKVKIFVEGLLTDIAAGMIPLYAISDRGKQAGFIKIDDYNELVRVVKRM